METLKEFEVVEEAKEWLDILLQNFEEIIDIKEKEADYLSEMERTVLNITLKKQKKNIKLIRVIKNYLVYGRYAEAWWPLKKLIEVFETFKIDKKNYQVLDKCEKYLHKNFYIPHV